MHKALMESVKSNKEKEDHSTGEKIPQVKGTLHFSEPLSEVSIYDKTDVNILTNDELRLLQSSPNVNLNDVTQQIIQISTIINSSIIDFKESVLQLQAILERNNELDDNDRRGGFVSMEQ